MNKKKKNKKAPEVRLDRLFLGIVAVFSAGFSVYFFILLGAFDFPVSYRLGGEESGDKPALADHKDRNDKFQADFRLLTDEEYFSQISAIVENFKAASSRFSPEDDFQNEEWLNEINGAIDKILEIKGIPKRFQQPTWNFLQALLLIRRAVSDEPGSFEQAEKNLLEHYENNGL